jgi:hypothetical protein
MTGRSRSHLSDLGLFTGAPQHEHFCRHQWWLPEGNRGDFMAIGVYNQFMA